jgi:ribosomal-protein-alanine N-acetyltransferase
MIETERLIVRPFLENDYKELHEYLSLPEIYRFERGEPISLKQAKKITRDWAKGENFWAAILKENKKLVGHLSFFPEGFPDFKTWQVGYIFHPKYQNKGYATETTQAIIKYAFSELGAHRIVIHCSPDNIASWKTAEKCGLRREGLEKKNFLHPDENDKPVWFDSYIYAILDEEFV